MSEMMKQVSLVLDEESRELARRLGEDLIDATSREPEWVRTLVATLNEVKASCARLEPALARVGEAQTSHDSAMTQKAADLANSIARLSAEPDWARQMSARVDTAFKEVAQPVARLSDAVTPLATSARNLDTTHTAMKGMLERTERTTTSLAVGTQGNKDGLPGELRDLARSLGDSRHDQVVAMAAISRMAENVTKIADQLKTQQASLERLARPWYRRLFGG